MSLCRVSMHRVWDRAHGLRLTPSLAQLVRLRLEHGGRAHGTCDAVATSMKLREIMKPDPIAITEETRLGDAHQLMRANRIRHLPVIADGRLHGILSERDIFYYRAAIHTDEDWWRAPAKWAMVVPVQTAGPDDSLTEAAGRLATAKIGALPIVEHGALIGLVTATDVLAAEVREAMR